MDAASTRANLTLARTARAVWAGTHLSDNGLSEYLAAVLNVETAVPQEQTMFALRASTAALPKIKRTPIKRNAA